MRPRSLRFPGIIILLLAALPYCAAGTGGAGADDPSAALQVSPGRWEGTLSIRQSSSTQKGITGTQGQSLVAAVMLTLLDEGKGALLDIPEQSMYGYPLDEVSWSRNRLKFSFDALGTEDILQFDGVLSANLPASAAYPAGGGIIGTVTSRSWRGTFTLRQIQRVQPAGETVMEVAVKGGALPGTLALPVSVRTGYPLAVLLAGAGPTDRNGNNYNVPGKSDSLAQLAAALAKRGVASFRFDKRGSGEAYMLEKDGYLTSLETHAEDAAAVICAMAALEDKSRLIVVGMNEGAWVGARALNLDIEADGFVIIAASGEMPRVTLARSLEGMDEAVRREADSIIASIISGEDFPAPSDVLADFFSSGRRGWLKTWLSFDPVAEVSAVDAPLLFLLGTEDRQIDAASFERLLSARPESPARLVPSMNYALKTVSGEEENYASFTDPEYPVSEALADILAAFAKAKPAPAGTLQYVPGSAQ